VIDPARRDLLDIYSAALRRVEGRRCVREYLNASDLDGCAMVAIGKAAQSMALGAVDALGERIAEGLVISKQGHLDWAQIGHLGFEAIEGGHPVPDEGSLAAGAALLAFIGRQPSGRPLLFLISGGTSSLVEAPQAGVTLEHLRKTNNWLLGSGLSIREMNRVRRRLSRIKGGGLIGYLGDRHAQALLISDVQGDDPAVIGSGLLMPPPADEAGEPLPHLPDALAMLMAGIAKTDDALGRTTIPHNLVTTLGDALQTAASRAKELGHAVTLHTEFVSGDATEAGACLATHLLSSASGVHIWGGETTLRLPLFPGRGGRNQHLALAAARQMAGYEGVYLLAAGTDGSDGPGEDAGALVDGGTLDRAQLDGFDADTALRTADSGSLLDAAGDLINTGPTGSNVMDLMIGLRR